MENNNNNNESSSNNTTNRSLLGQEPTYSYQFPWQHEELNLNLGKRPYIENENTSAVAVMNKRGRPYDDVVPRCQVEGCHVALVNAKAYHRKHKVCEMHAKAPKVVVLGLQQRFCQQCSRFHLMSEFDESKRSCRRRLAGHNERRRKSSQHHFPENKAIAGDFGHFVTVNEGVALSLLSSKNDSCVPKCNIFPAARCNVNVSELIDESGATSLAPQLILLKDWHTHQQQSYSSTNNHMVLETCRIHEATAGYLTLDLMNARNFEFGFVSRQPQQSKEEVVEEDGVNYNTGTPLRPCDTCLSNVWF